MRRKPGQERELDPYYHLVGRKEGGLSVYGVPIDGGFRTRVRWEHLCSSLASLGRAQGWASVCVSSKLTPAKEESWSLKAMGISAPRAVGSRRERGQGLPYRGDLYLTSFIHPCLAFCL